MKAWAYQHRPNVTGFLPRRRKNLAFNGRMNRMACKAQRLYGWYEAFADRAWPQTAAVLQGRRGIPERLRDGRLLREHFTCLEAEKEEGRPGS